MFLNFNPVFLYVVFNYIRVEVQIWSNHKYQIVGELKGVIIDKNLGSSPAWKGWHQTWRDFSTHGTARRYFVWIFATH